jgi:hypothetical protein
MTHQDFNHIFYKFTGNKRGVRPEDHLSTTGKELKDFVEFVLKHNKSHAQEIME